MLNFTQLSSIKSNLCLFAGCSLLLAILFFTLIIPLGIPYTYEETFLEIKNTPPDSLHWFGTDDLGRDILARVCFGAKISLTVALLASFLDLTFGFLWGSAAALLGGKADRAMNRFMDILFSIPYLLLTIALVVVIGSGIISLAIALSLIGWIPMARIVRGQIIQVKQMEYYVAAQVVGAGFWRLLLVHVLPNISGSVLVSLAFTIPGAIFAEAFLSYLGIGLQPPIASLGTMTYEALPSLSFYPWRLFFPAAFIVLLILAFNLIGEGLKQSMSKDSS